MTANANPNLSATLQELFGIQINVRSAEALSKMREGVIVKVHASRWRGRVPLRLEDLGIFIDPDERRAYDQVVKLGSLVTLPDKIETADGQTINLPSIETRARRLASSHGIETRWGTLIPYTRWAAFRQEFDSLVRDWDAAAADIEERFDDYVELITGRVAAAARVSYRTYVARTSANDLAVLMDEDRFVDNVVALALKSIPHRRSIRSTFSLEMEASYVPLPDQIDRRESETAESVAYWNEVKRSEELAAMNEEIAAQTRNRAQALMEGFFKDVAKQSRNLALEAYEALYERLSAPGGFVHARNVVQLKNMLSVVTDLAEFSGDEDIARKLEVARQIIDRDGDNRRESAGTIELALSNVISEIRSQLEMLDAVSDQVSSVRSRLTRDDLSAAAVEPAPAPARRSQNDLTFDVADLTAPKVRRGG